MRSPSAPTIADTTNRLFIFLDESGDFNFSRTGTAKYTFSALSAIRPFPAGLLSLIELKYDFWEAGMELEYFHAAEDKQAVRDKVFSIICKELSVFRCDCVIVEKRKTNPTLREPARFYRKMIEILLKFVLVNQTGKFHDVLVVCDTMPVKRNRRALERGIKATLKGWAKTNQSKYEILWCASKSELCLQITDYVNWAIYRKWEIADLRSYNLIKSCVKTEFDVFRFGTTTYY